MPNIERTTTRSWAHTSARERIRQRYFPDVLLTTHEGKKVRLYEDLIKDKVVVLNFFMRSVTASASLQRRTWCKCRLFWVNAWGATRSCTRSR